MVIISEQISSVAAKQNALEYEIEQYLPMLKENLAASYDRIFENTNDEYILSEAIKRAKSRNTTVEFLKIVGDSYEVIDECAQRMKTLAVMMAINQTNGEVDRRFVQEELDQLLKVIERKLSYTAIGNIKLYDGSFLAIEKTTLNTLKIENFSILTIEQAEQTIQKLESVIQIVLQKREEIANKIVELQNGNLEQEAQKGYAFEVTQGSNIPNEILKDYAEIVEKEELLKE